MPEAKTYQSPELWEAPKILTRTHVLVMGGQPGSGKSTLARYMQDQYDQGLTNMITIDSDDFRDPRISDPGAQIREATSHHLVHADILLQRGVSVALFGTYRKKEYRQDRRDYAASRHVDILVGAIDVPYRARLERILARDPEDSSDIYTEEDLIRVLSDFDPYVGDMDFILDGLESVSALHGSIIIAQARRGLIQRIEKAA